MLTIIKYLPCFLNFAATVMPKTRLTKTTIPNTTKPPITPPTIAAMVDLLSKGTKETSVKCMCTCVPQCGCLSQCMHTMCA